MRKKQSVPIGNIRVSVGEMSSRDMEESMMSEKNRRLEVLSVKDAEMARQSLEMLMGTEVSERREFLFSNVDFSKLAEQYA